METINVLSKEDIDLLKEVLPMNPCRKCSINARMGCCGCVEKCIHEQKLKPYNETGILELALQISYQRDRLNAYNQLEKEIQIDSEKLRGKLGTDAYEEIFGRIV